MCRYGFKCRLGVGTKSQYILKYLFSLVRLNIRKVPIPLLTGISERLASHELNYAIIDAGYDYVSIYEQNSSTGHSRLLIAIERTNRRQSDSTVTMHRPVHENISINTTVMIKSLKTLSIRTQARARLVR